MTRKSLQFVAALWLACCGFAFSAAALPPAPAYPGKTGALKEPNDNERDLLKTMNADRAAAGLPALDWDPMISAVAREQAQDMLDFDHLDYASSRLGTIEYRLHRSGISAGNSRYIIFRTNSNQGTIEQLRESHLYLDKVTDVGIGVVSKGVIQKTYCTAIILVERHGKLSPFPTLPLINRAYKLAGTIEAGYEKPEVIVTAPNGNISDTPLTLDADRKYNTVVRFDKGEGEYSVELTAEGPLGPTVLELMHCYAGQQYPPPEVAAEEQTPRDLRQAETAMLEIVNRTRAKNGLQPLRLDEKVSAVARAHSEDMLQNNFFAHISPTNGTLADRLARGEIRARKFTENLAANRTLQGAHKGLMDSPGHRQNILDPEVSAVGIGIARSNDGQLIITEDFIAPFAIYDGGKLETELLAKINDARARDNLPPLVRSAPLERAARENSILMREKDELGYGRAKEALDREKLDLKYVNMGVLKSSDPPTPGQFKESLERRFSVVGISVVQRMDSSGDRPLFTTVLLGEK